MVGMREFKSENLGKEVKPTIRFRRRKNFLAKSHLVREFQDFALARDG